MDLNLRFWNFTKNEVEIRYWDSQFLGHSTAAHIFENFTSSLDSLKKSSTIQVLMDGPSTNWAFLDLLTSDREAEELPKLVNIGSCGLHIVHGTFKTGFESVDWAVKNTLKGCYNLLHDSPARRDDYVSVSGSDIFPLSFCATRWVEDKIVADRLLSIWDNVVKVIRVWEKKPKSKQPKCKSYINVQKACNDIFTVARLNFFSYVAGFFKPFLKSYQSNSPMIPYLYTDLSELVKKILQLFIRADVIMQI